jgi:hypothetical protein
MDDSFNDALANALSPNPRRRAAAGDTVADIFTQAMANDVAGNDVSLIERGVFGTGSPSRDMAQYLADEAFRTRPGNDEPPY